MRLALAVALAALFAATSASAQAPPDDQSTPTPTPTPTPTLPPVVPDDLPMLARAYPAPPPPHQTRIFGAFELGYAYARLFDIPINGLDFSGLIGADLGSWGIGAQLDVVTGRTDGGLDTFALAIGPAAEAHIDRFRLGGGVRIGAFNVTRATNTGSLATATAGAFARLSVDVLQFDDEGNGAFFVVVKGSVDSTPDPLYCATAGVGIRF